MMTIRRIHLVVAAMAASVILPGPAAVVPTAEAQSAESGRPAGSVTVQVTPSSVPESGGEVELYAIVRDDRGRPLAGAHVNFLTETGTLGSRGRLAATGADGGVADRLMVTEAELAAVEENTFRLAAAVGADGRDSERAPEGREDLRTANVGIRILRAPKANFGHAAGGRMVVFNDLSRGFVTDRLWTFGDGATSTRHSPSHTFAEPGWHAVTLRAGNSVGADEVTRLVWIGRDPDKGGQASSR